MALEKGSPHPYEAYVSYRSGTPVLYIAPQSEQWGLDTFFVNTHTCPSYTLSKSDRKGFIGGEESLQNDRLSKIIARFLQPSDPHRLYDLSFPFMIIFASLIN